MAYHIAKVGTFISGRDIILTIFVIIVLSCTLFIENKSAEAPGLREIEIEMTHSPSRPQTYLIDQGMICKMTVSYLHNNDLNMVYR